MIRHLDVECHSDSLTLCADLAEVDSLVAEDLDAVGPVVGDEDLLPVVDHHAVGELEVLGAAELVQHVSHLGVRIGCNDIFPIYGEFFFGKTSLDTLRHC